MAYLDNTTITIDAILTKKGRELFAKSSQDFKITKFALADDEIDYRLYDKSHPSGSNYYSAAIQSMPLLEALPDGSKMLRYKLITLLKDTATVPIISVASTAYTLYAPETVGSSQIPGGSAKIVPQTTNGLNSSLGYSATLYDSKYVTLSATGAGSMQGRVLEDSGVVTLKGSEFIITGKALPSGTTSASTTLRIIGNETGGSIIINITVRRKTSNDDSTEH